MDEQGKEKDQTLNLSISTNTIYKTIFVCILLYLLYFFRDIVLILLAAVVIASAIEPATQWSSKFKIHRIPAVIVVYLLVISIFGSILFIAVPVVIDDVLQADKAYNISTVISEYSEENSILSTNDYADKINSNEVSFKDTLNNIQSVVTGSPEKIFNTVSTFFGGIVSFVLIFVLSFYMSVQENGITNFLKVITPIKYRNYVIRLWKRSQRKIGSWMQGQLLLVIMVGLLVLLGLSILGVKYAILLAIMAGLAELIPIFGPVLASIPALFLAFMDGTQFTEPGIISVIIIAIFYSVIHQTENHFLYPMVMRKIVGLHPIIVIISIIIGAKLAGFLGVLLAVPVSAVIMEFANDIQKGVEVKSI